jgi:signal transduction histidine kinase
VKPPFPRRSILVLLLLLVAVGVPFRFWFRSGSSEADRQSRLIVYAARTDAQLAADSFARRLRVRLESIRAQEAKRPYFHYQNLFHDPRGASQGLAVVPSPLATGPADPLIATYFQIDARARVTLPTLNEDLSELSSPDARRQDAIRKTIATAAPQAMRVAAPFLAAVQAESDLRHKQRSNRGEDVKGDAKSPEVQQAAAARPEAKSLAQRSQSKVASPVPKSEVAGTPSDATGDAKVPETQQAATVLRLESQAFAQNVQSNLVYSELKPEKKSAPRAKPRIPSRSAPDVEIVMGDLFWTTLDVAGTRSLAALRPVVTPDGSILQGFLVSNSALTDALGPAGGSLRLRARGTPSTRAVPIGRTGWSIEIDESAATARASARSEQIERAFRQAFYGGVLAAILAVGTIAMLMWRTERLARERAQFASAAAHELRTPLAGLRLYGDMLAHQLGDPDRSKFYAEQISREADRLGRVVSNMLEFTRLERGSLSIRPERGDLASTVRECVEHLRPALEAAGCSVDFSAEENLSPVSFDRDALHHVVQNLLDNAERYSRSSEVRTIDVSVVGRNGGAAVVVSDRGVGIDAKAARHLFLPFQRDTPSGGLGGLGLGLVLVKALVQAHGGQVSWSARMGGGTTFDVVLPAS